MTGKEKIEAAFSPEGSDEFAAVIPYEDIYIRDHWLDLTSRPWWMIHSPRIEDQIAWQREVAERTGQDWFTLGCSHPREVREHLSLDVRPDGVFLVDAREGREVRLHEPQIGGWSVSGEVESIAPTAVARTQDEVDRLIPHPVPLDEEEFRASGVGDLAEAMLADYGADRFPICRVGSPLWSCYGLWGFEEMMAMIASDPQLVGYASARYAMHSVRAIREAALLGARGVWIEECLTDMIGPAAFEAINVPLVRLLTEEIRAAGMKSIYYFCGDPAGRLEMLLTTGTDALALEEGKKGFEIDIEQVADAVRGRCVLLGNIDAIGVLQNGTDDDLRAEIGRQASAGRRNGGRFIMSLGSPVTPSTPVERVRLYCDTAHGE